MGEKIGLEDWREKTAQDGGQWEGAFVNTVMDFWAL
jgi:hypothetical protein